MVAESESVVKIVIAQFSEAQRAILTKNLGLLREWLLLRNR